MQCSWKADQAIASTVLAGVFAISTLSAAPACAQANASAYTSATRYDAMGRVTGTIAPDPDGSGALKHTAVRNTYDAAGRLTKVETGELALWQSENVAASAWAGFTVHHRVETTYDLLGRKLTERAIGSDNVVASLTQYSYDSLGRLECVALRMNPAAYGTLPASACSLATQGNYGPDRITRNVYDAAGQLLQVREGVGTPVEAAEATYSYTPNGKRRYVVDGNGSRAELRYDGFDRQLRWVFPSQTLPGSFNDSTPANALATAGGLNEADYEQYGYDANGNRVSLRKRDGRTLVYQYDALNRMTVKTVPDGVIDATYTRDVYYGYDLRGLQTFARFDSAAGPGVSFGYDGFGRKTSERTQLDNLDRTLAYQYDRDGNRTRLTHPDGNGISIVRDGLGRTYYSHLTGGSPLVYPSRDAAGRLSVLYRFNVGIGDWQGLGTGHSYDPISRLASFWHVLPGTSHDLLTAFTFNPASQITSRTTDNDAYAFTANINVNRSYTSNGLNQYTAAGPASFTYDANGNLASDGTANFVYDVENRLVWRYQGANSTTLRYDPLGRLYEVNGTATAITRFLHDGQDLIAEYDASGALLRRYVHGDGAGDDPQVWFEGASVADSARRYLFSDERGSITAVTDAQGAPFAINRYDEYGIPAASNQGRFQYTGQLWLPELGMYYYKARMYSPTLGRFMQTDPIGYEDQINLYAYVANDPVNGVDPTGMYECGDTDGKACSAAREAVSEMEAAKKYYETPETGSRIARNAQAAKAIGESLDALGKEGDGNGVTVQVGELNRSAGELGRHVSDGWGNSTITLDTAAINASGWSYGAILGHEASHRFTQTQGWTGFPDWRIYSEARGYSVQANIQLFVNPQVALDNIGSTSGAAYDWLRRRTKSSACGGLGGYTAGCMGRVDTVFNQMGF